MSDTGNLDRSAVGTVTVGGSLMGAIREMTVRNSGEIIEHVDVSDYPFGSDYEVFGKVNLSAEIVWEEIGDINLWAKVLHGGTPTVTTAGTTSVTDEVVTLTGVVWTKLAYADDFDYDCAVVVGSLASGAGTTYTENTDYFVDRRNGYICRISTGSISDGQAVYVDYVYDTYVGTYFEIMSDSTPTQYDILIVKPLTNGNNMRIRHTLCTFGVEQELSLTPGDEGEWVGTTSTIKFMKDVGGTYGTFGRWEIYTP